MPWYTIATSPPHRPVPIEPRHLLHVPVGVLQDAYHEPVTEADVIRKRGTIESYREQS